ncbi:MAG: CBS domain-containing protein, partial [Gammaproteobacteria bacterium]|nr:CBS domain-containing protein [Gammaproteobacteria bacterium]
ATFWRQLAIPSAFIITWLVKLVWPLVWISTRLTRLFSHSRGVEITREEIIALASLGLRDGTLMSRENEYLGNILKLREIRTEEVLTPRSVVHMLDQNLTVTEALDLPQTRQFARMPVYGEGIDDIKGKVLRVDLFETERNGQGSEPVKAFAKKITRVSEKLPVQQLLDQFIKNRADLFLVEDEFGQTAGIVTLEDAIETLLGREILDERDTVEDMQALARGKYRQRLREEKQLGDLEK